MALGATAPEASDSTTELLWEVVGASCLLAKPESRRQAARGTRRTKKVGQGGRKLRDHCVQLLFYSSQWGRAWGPRLREPRGRAGRTVLEGEAHERGAACALGRGLALPFCGQAPGGLCSRAALGVLSDSHVHQGGWGLPSQLSSLVCPSQAGLREPLS